MSNTVKVSINAPTEIDDESVIDQLPKSIIKSLGKLDGSSGCNLLTGLRDVGFDRGIIKYKVGDTSVEVLMD